MTDPKHALALAWSRQHGRCHCESPYEAIPPGHVDTCPFVDPDYCPPTPDQGAMIVDLFEALKDALRKKP
jgi:hypothetical protein